MNAAKSTIIEKCFSLAGAALAGSWNLHNTNEALFWFHSVLKLEPQNSRACLGAARAYQYIASQPWWYNDTALAKRAAASALAMAERVSAPADPVGRREIELVLGQTRSAIGEVDLAEQNFERAMSLDDKYPVSFYFYHFNKMFYHPCEEIILPGLAQAIALAEAEGNRRRLAVAFYFRGFAYTVFRNYPEAIRDLERSMKLNPGYGSANLALIAATALSRHRDAYKAVRSFKERYPDLAGDILDYMWVDRSSCSEYHRLVRPMVEIVKGKLAH